MPKAKTAREKLHMGSVADMGCIACAQLGYYDSPTELHHIKHQTGMGRRSSHYEVIGLCYVHHRGNYGYHYSPAEFTGTFGTQLELLQLTLNALSLEGCKCGCIKKTGQTAKPNPFNRFNQFYE